jgi:hypothetical protein
MIFLHYAEKQGIQINLNAGDHIMSNRPESVVNMTYYLIMAMLKNYLNYRSVQMYKNGFLCVLVSLLVTKAYTGSAR